MIRLNVNGQVIAISGDIVAEAIIEAMPGWLSGKETPSAAQGIIKSGLKAIIPMGLGMAHKHFIESGLPMPAPDFKSPAARESMIPYALRYMLGNMTELSDGTVFEAQSETLPSGEIIIRGVAAAVPAMATEAETLTIE